MSQAVTLSVGEGFHLKRGKDRIIYGGMPSDDVYCMVQVKASGYQGYAWSLFYPKKKQQITIDEVSILVENATPDEIRFRVE